MPDTPALSGYRIMWLIVMFDLPVLTKAERRAATKFRQWLLDEGWEMSQFSVYMRFCAGKEQVDARLRQIGRNVPPQGKVHVLAITDRQFEKMAVFRGGRSAGGKRSPSQFELF
ncbi:CRISPR-associated endonuclease Cas2 [Geminicoccaceae bacterium 1502E]|nr:CRISPR-associated endonuclease Cas2 [Geminicoccaceae bacterium 1502E]